MGDYPDNSGYQYPYNTFNIAPRNHFSASAVHYNNTDRNERPHANFAEDNWNSRGKSKISLDAYKERKSNHTNSTSPSVPRSSTDDSTSRHRYDSPKPIFRDSRDARGSSDSGRNSETNSRDPRTQRSRWDSKQQYKPPTSSYNNNRRYPESSLRAVKDDRIQQAQADRRNYIRQLESKTPNHSGVVDHQPSWDQPGPPVANSSNIDPLWNPPPLNVTTKTCPSETTRNSVVSSSQAVDDDDDEIVFVKRVRTKRRNKTEPAIIVDLDAPKRPVKIERFDADETIKMEVPWDSTVDIQNTPPHRSSTPILDPPPTPVVLPTRTPTPPQPIVMSVPVQVHAPVPPSVTTPTTHNLPTPNNRPQYEHLAGISLKMEGMQNSQMPETEEQIPEPATEEVLHRPSVVCGSCHLRVGHVCKYPPEQQQGNFITPGQLYTCKCNFMFSHKFNCGIHKRKDAFAPVSRQNGLLKQVNRTHDFQCHQCPFKFFLEGLKSGEHYFEKLKKNDLANPCQIIEKVNKVSRRLYRKEMRPFKSSSALPYILRSEEDYINIRRNHILRCTAGCCQVFHECNPKNLHENRDKD